MGGRKPVMSKVSTLGGHLATIKRGGRGRPKVFNPGVKKKEPPQSKTNAPAEKEDCDRLLTFQFGG